MNILKVKVRIACMDCNAGTESVCRPDDCDCDGTGEREQWVPLTALLRALRRQIKSEIAADAANDAIKSYLGKDREQAPPIELRTDLYVTAQKMRGVPPYRSDIFGRPLVQPRGEKLDQVKYEHGARDPRGVVAHLAPRPDASPSAAPWYIGVEMDENGIETGITIVSQDSRVIARVHPHREAMADDPLDDKAMADARLMAKAPIMRTILCEIHQVLNAGWLSGDVPASILPAHLAEALHGLTKELSEPPGEPDFTRSPRARDCWSFVKGAHAFLGKLMGESTLTKEHITTITDLWAQAGEIIYGIRIRTTGKDQKQT